MELATALHAAPARPSPALAPAPFARIVQTSGKGTVGPHGRGSSSVKTNSQRTDVSTEPTAQHSPPGPPLTEHLCFIIKQFRICGKFTVLMGIISSCIMYSRGRHILLHFVFKLKTQQGMYGGECTRKQVSWGSPRLATAQGVLCPLGKLPTYKRGTTEKRCGLLTLSAGHPTMGSSQTQRHSCRAWWFRTGRSQDEES